VTVNSVLCTVLQIASEYFAVRVCVTMKRHWRILARQRRLWPRHLTILCCISSVVLTEADRSVDLHSKLSSQYQFCY